MLRGFLFTESSTVRRRASANACRQQEFIQMQEHLWEQLPILHRLKEEEESFAGRNIFKYTQE